MRKNETIEVTIEAPCGINSQTGKSEEIEILSRITNRFEGTQTYLESLFSESLLEYFSGTVEDDFCPDIMADYRAELENRRKADAEAASLRTQLECRNSDLERLQNAAKGELIGKDLIDASKSVLASIAWTTIAHSDPEKGIMAKLPALRAAIAKAEGK